MLLREERSKPGAEWERPVRYTWFGPQGVEVTEVHLASVPTWRAARPSDGTELVVLEGDVFLVDPASGDVRRILEGSALSVTWSAGGGAVVTQDSILYLDGAGGVLETVDRDGATVAWGAGDLRPVFANRTVTLGGEVLCRPDGYRGFAVDPNGRWAACLDKGFLRVFDGSGSLIANMQVGFAQFPQPIEAHSWGLAWRDIRLLTAPAPDVPPSRWEPPLPPTLAPGRRSVSARLSDGSSGVTVYAVPGGDPLTWQRAPEALHVREAATDASGTVRFDGLAAGVWELWVDGRRVTTLREGDTEIDVDRPKQITRRGENTDLSGGVVVSSSLGSVVEASIGSDGAWEIQTRASTRLRSCA
ncbi:MAG: hypothetical protein KC621_15525, partial [Myxococcales bacterium]|nr:hypothetical protein [Myxococcales bacterium]